MLSYAVVVATRNRLDILRVSLPLFLAQSRLPGRVVVVDRSDDHHAVKKLCEALGNAAAAPIEVCYGTEANSASQRNQGIDRVTEDVILFPDDDSLWYPDTAEKTMAVYEADTNRRYGAVSANDVYESPVGTDADIPRRASRLTELPGVMSVRNRIEAALVPQPFEVYGAERIAQLAPIARGDQLGYELVGTIGGYRMSFRTEVAKRLRFDDVLGSRIGYAVHEDKDMALRVLASGSLIAVAPGARVFHSVAPGKRAAGFQYGFFQILNYLYVCRKVFPQGSRAMAVTHRYLGYKVFLYSLRRADEYDREVHRGAAAALAEYEAMMSAPQGEFAERYAEICDRHS